MNKMLVRGILDASSCLDALSEALDCGTIDTETISKWIDLRDKKKRVQLVHQYAVTKVPNGRWQTYFKLEGDKKRKIVRSATEDGLYEKLYDLYMNKVFLENMTLNTLYEEWIAYKKCITESPNTVRRHEQHYARYFRDGKFFSQKLGEMNATSVNAYCNQLIKDHQMTRHEWTNVKTILKGMFELAEEKDYIRRNPMDRLKITVKFRQVNRKFGDTETFNSEEIKSLYAYLDERYEMSQDVALLAVKANTMMGLRVGELVALKWKDIVDEKHLHVCREEVRDQEKGIYEIAHHTKTRQDRIIVIVPQVAYIFEEIRILNDPVSADEYIFMREGKRLTSRRINYVLEKYAERTGTKKKSSHKLRKTYASMLQERGVPLDEIRKQLGHSDLQTTMAYVFNPLTETETYDRIATAFSGPI